MKKLVTLMLAAILLVGGCANFNQGESISTEKNGVDKQSEYINESLGYAINIPKSVKDRVSIKRNRDALYIVSNKIAKSDSEYPGIILYINPMSKSDYPSRQDLETYIKDEAPVPLVIMGETKNDYICYNFATDLEYPPDDEASKKEYNDLKNEFSNNGFDFRVLD